MTSWVKSQIKYGLPKDFLSKGHKCYRFQTDRLPSSLSHCESCASEVIFSYYTADRTKNSIGFHLSFGAPTRHITSHRIGWVFQVLVKRRGSFLTLDEIYFRNFQSYGRKSGTYIHNDKNRSHFLRKICIFFFKILSRFPCIFD